MENRVPLVLKGIPNTFNVFWNGILGDVFYFKKPGFIGLKGLCNFASDHATSEDKGQFVPVGFAINTYQAVDLDF